jgi:diguanylate cyclase (GGDEF)-like protein
MDALAGILRDFGKHGFDLAKQDARRTRAVFDQWAQHVVLGSEAPGQKGPVSALAQRHFAELRAFFQSHRKTEQAEVNASQDALRDVVWNFVASLNRVTHEDQQDDVKVGGSLTRLASAVDSADTQDIRRLALDAIREVNTVLATRKERQARQVADLAARLETLGTQLEVARRESTTDALTHLFNRRAFDDQLPRVSELAKLRGCQAAMLIIDLDHFKKVNDTWGHPAGDAVIRVLAHECIRVFKRKGDFVARYGGEEVVVLLTDLQPVEAVAQADKLREVLAAQPIAWEGATLQVTCSIGVAAWKKDEPPAQWLARADAALYRAKDTGRNRVSLD